MIEPTDGEAVEDPGPGAVCEDAQTPEGEPVSCSPGPVRRRVYAPAIADECPECGRVYCICHTDEYVLWEEAQREAANRRAWQRTPLVEPCDRGTGLDSAVFHDGWTT